MSRAGVPYRAPVTLALIAWLAAAPAGPQSPPPVQGPTPVSAASPFDKIGDPERAQEAFDLAERAESKGDWATAFQAYAEAATLAPENAQYRLKRESARFHLVQQHVDRAERAAISGELDEAREELRRAVALDPGYAIARERLKQIEDLTEKPPLQLSSAVEGEVHLQPQPGTRSIDYRGDTQGAYEEVGRQFGLTATFDVDFHARQIRFRVDDLDFWSTLRVLGEQTGTFWRALTPRLFLVAENTPQKVKEYAPSVLRSVILPESETPDQMTETLRLVRDIGGITRTQLDLNSRTISMRASEADIALALDLIAQVEQPPGELLLEIEVLEVDLNTARNLGLTPPTETTVFTISPLQVRQAQQSLQGLLQVITQLFGQPSSLAGLSASQVGALVGSGQIGAGTLIPPLVAFGGGLTTFLSTLPGAVANFSDTLSLVRSGRRVLLRVQDARPATFFVGDRVPVSLGLLSPSLGVGAIAPQLSTGGFPITNLGTGKSPVGITTGDFNGDGKLDLAAVNQADNTVSVLLNQGNGAFAAKQDFATGKAPTAVVTGDFNGDGKLDLAVVNQTDNTVSILLGNGDGTFGPSMAFPTGSAPVALLAGDFNGDGKLDIAAVNKGSNTVSILLGNGDGTLKGKNDLATGASPVAIASADFDNDGKLDLAVVNQGDNTVTVLLGNGNGTFTAQTNAPATGVKPTGVVARDFNVDGRPDLAVANQTDNTVSILFGNGDGTFQAKADFPTGTGPVAMASADFNSDGTPDLAIADQGGNTLSIIINNGSGAFAFKLDIPVGNSPSAVAVGDFTGSGRQDAAVTDQIDNAVSVVLNNTTFTSGSSASSTAYPSAEYEDLGLKVKATPRLHPNHEVTLQMEFEIRSLANTEFNGVPVISNRTISQTVRLREDETTALAGILQPTEMRTVTGWPWLATAGQRKTQGQDSELLILITPRLLRLAVHRNHSYYAGLGRSSVGGASAPTVPQRPGVP